MKPRFTESALWRYFVAVLSVAIALAVRFIFGDEFTRRIPFAFYLLAILVASRLGGLGPGLLATLLNILAAEFLFQVAPDGASANPVPEPVALIPVAIVGVCVTLISAQLRTALARSAAEHERFRVISDNVPEFIWTATPDGSIDFMNSRFYEYTGMARDSALGTGWAASVHPDDLPGVSSYWAEILASGKDGDLEFRIRRQDGVYHWFVARAVPLRNTRGRVVRWFGSNTDVQESRELRDALTAEAAKFNQIQTPRARPWPACPGARSGAVARQPDRDW